MMIRFNNLDKGTIAHTIVHRALWKYYSIIGDTQDEAEKERLQREIFNGYVRRELANR
jgi:hypothetical protein